MSRFLQQNITGESFSLTFKICDVRNSHFYKHYINNWVSDLTPFSIRSSLCSDLFCVTSQVTPSNCNPAPVCAPLSARPAWAARAVSPAAQRRPPSCRAGSGSHIRLLLLLANSCSRTSTAEIYWQRLLRLSLWKLLHTTTHSRRPLLLTDRPTVHDAMLSPSCYLPLLNSQTFCPCSPPPPRFYSNLTQSRNF